MHSRFLVLALVGVVVSLMVHTEAFGESSDSLSSHGLVGLRPLPRTAELDHKSSGAHGNWVGSPTYDKQAGKYPYVAEHLDTVKGWNGGDFKTKRVFFEHYWGIDPKRDVLDVKKNHLIQKIKNHEKQGLSVEHILIAREYRLAIQRGHPDAQPGPFKEDTRILYEKDIDDIRALFKEANKQGVLKNDSYKLIMMVEHPTFFSRDKRFLPILAKVEGIAYEAHQFNRHWPQKGKWSDPQKVAEGAKWTIDQDKEYIMYFGPIVWNKDGKKGGGYYPFIERDWLKAYWEAGMPKRHPLMHHYLNIFPHGSGKMRPAGPESNPHSKLGFTKWLINEIKFPGRNEEEDR